VLENKGNAQSCVVNGREEEIHGLIGCWLRCMEKSKLKYYMVGVL
jgi:hypothetical protein